MRSIVEKVVRNTSVKRRLPNGAEIFVSPDSQLKYIKYKFDIDLVNLARERVSKDSVVWDIGANCGVFALSCNVARSVVAVEPDPFLCHLLQKSVTENSLKNVTVVPAAVSDMVGLAEFAIAERGRASNYLVSFRGRSQAGGVRSTLLVPTVTLDAMLDRLPPPTFVKIDVEGAEAGVPRGAIRLLRDHRPTIYVEVDQSSADECQRILDEFSYSVDGNENWLAVPI